MADRITYRRRRGRDRTIRRRGRDVTLPAYEIHLNGRVIGIAYKDTRTIERGHPQAPSCISRRQSAPVWFASLGLIPGWAGTTTWFDTRKEATEALVRSLSKEER